MFYIEAIVFDLDGLMIDSEPLARKAWEKVLQDFGCLLDDETFVQMIGLRLEDSSRLVKHAFKLEISETELATREMRYMVRLMSQGIPTMPGLWQLLEQIERRQLPWAIATSSRRSYALNVLNQLDILDRCRALACGDEVDRGKPSPDIYLLAAERLGIQPPACLALEDSTAGVLAASGAGMRTVAVPNRDTSSLEFHAADSIYPSLEEVAADIDLLLA